MAPPWFRVDDDFFRNPKVVGLSKDAKLLYLSALALCHEQGTDGFLSPAMAKVAAGQVDVRPGVSRELVAAELWHALEEGGYEVHDYLKKQESKVSRNAAKAAHADRMRAWRDKSRDVSRDTSQRPSPSHHEPVTTGVTNGVGEGARAGASHSHREIYPSRGKPPGVAGESAPEMEIDPGKPQVSGPVAERWLTLFPRKRQEALEHLGAVLEHLDVNFVDEMIGHCMAMNPPPSSPRYLRKIAADWAQQRGAGLSVEALAQLAGKGS